MKFIKPNFWKKNSLITYLFYPLTIITRLIIFLKKTKKQIEPDIPTICVGNIYLGGTGKTQLVIELNKILKKNYKISVIKKYYKDQVDEQKLLYKNTNLVLSTNRLKTIESFKHNNNHIVILDDGLQDKKIKYKISVVCFNSLTGVGNGKLLPAGPLRESLSELKNYNAVFINGDKKRYLINLIKNSNNKIKIFNGKYFLKNKKDFSNKKRYFAFCGIGTPENFFELLKENNIKLKDKLIFPDHYDYKLSDVNRIKKLAKDINCQLITTEKDYMKIKKFKNFKTKFAKIDLKIYDQAKFINFLKKNL